MHNTQHLIELYADFHQAINYLIQLFYKTGQKYTCSRTKIGKLLSIVAFVYARRGYKLFDEKIYKYDGCGTAIREVMVYCDRDVYMQYRYFNNRQYIDDDFISDEQIPERYQKINNLNNELKEIIEDVFRHFGSFFTYDLGDFLNPIVELPQMVNENNEVNLNMIQSITLADFANNEQDNALINYLLKENV